MKNYENEIDDVVSKVPELTDFGLGVYDDHKLTADARNAKFAENRELMYTEKAREQFYTAREFLDGIDQTQKCNPRFSSYGLKHKCERWSGKYVTNGMFIAAAVSLGIKIKRDGTSPNAQFALSTRSIDQRMKGAGEG